MTGTYKYLFFTFIAFVFSCTNEETVNCPGGSLSILPDLLQLNDEHWFIAEDQSDSFKLVLDSFRASGAYSFPCDPDDNSDCGCQTSAEIRGSGTNTRNDVIEYRYRKVVKQLNLAPDQLKIWKDSVKFDFSSVQRVLDTAMINGKIYDGVYKHSAIGNEMSFYFNDDFGLLRFKPSGGQVYYGLKLD